MKVQDPHGQTWRVTRRWVPWRPRRRKLDPGMPDLIDGADDPIGCAFMLLAGIVLFFLVPILVVVLLAAVEVLLVLLLLPFAILGRVMFGQKWWVEAREGFTPRWEGEAGTWREAAALIRRTAAAIQHGDGPLPNLGKDRDLTA